MSANTILTSIVTGGSNSHATISEEANAVATDFVTAGVTGTIGLNVGSGGTGSFCVNADASPDMGVTIKAGGAYITATPSGQNSQVLRARAAADYTAYTINANASGSTKYDWIYLSVSAVNANTPSASADNVTSIVTSRSSSNTTDNGTPPTYGLLLAKVTVANGASSITNSNIYDARVSATITPANTSITTGWNALGYTPDTITANGNRSYSCVFTGIDLTGVLSAGTRLRTTRTSPAPTQCTSLNGTTQYYSKTSPAGMTFTNNFVVSAWVKPSNYTASIIASRYNGTSGWELSMQSTGQLRLTGFNAGAANFSYVQSYQSLPLNKWTHITLQLDMSTFTATTTTSYVMFDGLDIPATVVRGGTNPTALIQAGNLEIGSENGGTFPFTGKIAQVAIYSAKVTQTTIKASINQTLAGTETSLISAYSFNNSINDLNANSNNLTANGSAVATNADSPFGGQAGGTISSTLDYGIIQSVTFSTNTTVVVQVPEGCTIPTSGGVSAVVYSSNKAPYGMPVQTGKWIVGAYYKSQMTTGSIATITWGVVTGTGASFPLGEWVANYNIVSQFNPVSGGQSAWLTTLSTTSGAEANPDFTAAFQINGPATLAAFETNTSKRSSVSLSVATAYYMNIKNLIGVSGTGFMRGDDAFCSITFENAYL